MRSRAKLPLTLGHEIAGVVVEAGAGTKLFKSGDRVASTYRISCGYCRYCRGGHGEICDNRRGIGEHRDGGYAEYVALPESVLATVPGAVPFEQACVCGCVVGAVYNAVVKSAKVTAWRNRSRHGRRRRRRDPRDADQPAGRRSVIAITSSADKADRIRALGADEVVAGRAWTGLVRRGQESHRQARGRSGDRRCWQRDISVELPRARQGRAAGVRRAKSRDSRRSSTPH